jgi:hypothetical protein
VNLDFLVVRNAGYEANAPLYRDSRGARDGRLGLSCIGDLGMVDPERPDSLLEPAGVMELMARALTLSAAQGVPEIGVDQLLTALEIPSPKPDLGEVSTLHPEPVPKLEMNFSVGALAAIDAAGGLHGLSSERLRSALLAVMRFVRSGRP